MKNLILILMAVSTVQLANATNYYVSITGNDANSGTSTSTPWRTITKVNSVNFLPGDNLYFKGGEVFNGNIYLSASDGNSPTIIFTISSYGGGRATINAGNGYGISAYNTQGIRIENLIVTGSGMSTNTQDGIGFYADLAGSVKLKGVSFDNIEVKNFGKTGVKIGSWNGNTGYENLSLNNLDVHDNLWDGILVYGFIGYNNYVGYPHKNVTITNCRSYNNPGIADPNAIRGNGIVLSNTETGLIQNCVAYNNGANNIHCGGPGGIWVYDAKGIVIQYNESYGNKSTSTCDGLGFDLDGGSINCIMQYNYSHDNDGGGFLLGQMENGRPWKNNICRYNVSVNDGRHNAAGITLFKQGATTIMDSCFVYNNTVYMTPAPNNSSEAAFKITEWFTGITNVKVYNNIFVTTGGVPLVYVPTGYSGYFAGNLYWSSGAPFLIQYQGVNYSSLNTWRSATNNEKIGSVNTGLNVDPLLTNVGFNGVLYPNAPSTLNAYKLQSGSPALDAGLNLLSQFNINVGSTDYWGDPVVSGIGHDIGADEKVVSSSPCPAPVGLTIGNLSPTSVNLYWNPVTGAPNYSVRHRVVGTTTWQWTTATGTNLTVSNLICNTNYEWQVRANCPTGTTNTNPFSPSSTFTTTNCTSVCTTPSQLIASGISTNGVTLSWVAASALAYNLQYKVSSSSSWITISNVQSPYVLTGLLNCSSYDYKVQAICSIGTSLFSAPSTFITSGCGITYCNSNGNSTANEFINRVQIGSINNTSGNNNGYGNFVNLSTILSAGATANITLVPGYTGSVRAEAWDVYIDYNQNGSFSDSGERVTWAKQKNTVSRSFTIPATALNGPTRMRIQMKYFNYATGPCSVYNFGEVEDYTINIVGGMLAREQLTAPSIQSSSFEMLVHPNPTTDLVYVRAIGLTMVELYGMNGQMLMRDDNAKDEWDIDCAWLTPGIYFIKGYFKNGVSVRRLIVN